MIAKPRIYTVHYGSIFVPDSDSEASVVSRETLLTERRYYIGRVAGICRPLVAPPVEGPRKHPVSSVRSILAYPLSELRGAVTIRF